MEEKVRLLQKYLSIIRTCAGWSTTELGSKLGVTRQMISNLENGRNTMTIMQYRALRDTFSEEIRNSEKNNDTQMLKDVLRVLVDDYDSFTDEQRNQVLSDANLLAPSIVSKKTTRKKASYVWVAALAGGMLGAALLQTAKALLSSDDVQE